MRVFDLHCDTVFECILQGKSLMQNNLALDAERCCRSQTHVQVFAFWIDDKFRGQSAYDNFIKQHDFFKNTLDQNSGRLSIYDSCNLKPHHCNALLAVEGGAALAGKIENIAELKKRNISILTLCWNAANEIASGVRAEGGFTSFGREVVAELERQSIIVDVSHLNDTGFGELCEFAEKPFIASHSNAFSICQGLGRNLKDWQIKEIADRQGIIGLNFCNDFLGDHKNVGFDTISRHIEHFLGLGCENVLSLGSDFDGAETPEYLKSVGCLEEFYSDIKTRFGGVIAENIFYGNACNFFKKHI